MTVERHDKGKSRQNKGYIYSPNGYCEHCKVTIFNDKGKCPDCGTYSKRKYHWTTITTTIYEDEIENEFQKCSECENHPCDIDSIWTFNGECMDFKKKKV